MFYHRPSITPSWNQRIYPVHEPSFAPPVSSDRTSPPTSPTGSTSPRPRARSLATLGETTATSEGVSATTAASPPVREAPPPVYYPGPAQRRLSAAARGIDDTVPRGHIASINTARTSTCVVRWLNHPAAPEAMRPRDEVRKRGFRQDWRSWIRLPLIWRALKQEPEVLWNGWPVEFGGQTRVPWEAEMMRDREEGASASDSQNLPPSFTPHPLGAMSITDDVALSRFSSAASVASHPLEAQYRRRIAELNTLIAESLSLTRIWLALIELMDIIWFVCLIIAIGVEKGQQKGFILGVEVGLVLVILLNGLAINGVRMRRWTLAQGLRARTRDWSPLPITSSTNSGLMRNYLDGDASDRDRTDSMQPKEGPVLRWRLRETEGGYWLGYRPIIRCELVVPASYAYSFAPIDHLPVLAHAESRSPRESTSTTEAAHITEEGGPARGPEPPSYDQAV